MKRRIRTCLALRNDGQKPDAMAGDDGYLTPSTRSACRFAALLLALVLRSLTAPLVATLAIIVAPGEAAANGLSAATPVSYEDLLGIVDLGVTGPRASGGIAVAPNGAAIAIEARRGDWRNNRTSIRWLIISLDGERKVIDVGDGGEPIPYVYEGTSTGYSPAQIPIWSPDSRWIAYRVQKDNQTQLWRSRSDGTVREKLTSNAADVEAFHWSKNGGKLLFIVGPSRDEIAAAFQREAKQGFRYDERFDQLLSGAARPMSPAGLTWQRTVWVYDLTTRGERLANAAEQIEYQNAAGETAPRSLEENASGAIGPTSPSVLLIDLPADKGGGGVTPPATLAVSLSAEDSSGIRCSEPLCTGRFIGAWVRNDGKGAVGLRWTGQFDYGSMTLFEWNVESKQVKEILTTDDYLEGCSLARDSLVCGLQSPTTPTKLVIVDLSTGRIRTLYDPNESFQTKRFGEVTAMTWLDNQGQEGFGHVVKPIDYQPGRRYPLVIVQYRSRGFLRGGVGDEYPIHVFAAQGFVVLSFHRPDDWPLRAQSRTFDEEKEKGWIDFRDRKLVLSVLEAGIDELAELGLIDPKKVGITGLSDGAETLAFALIHTPNRFAAAAVSGTVWNPISYYIGGPRLQPLFHRWHFGVPESTDENSQWRGMSLAMNASRIVAPLLIQVSDAEMLPATQTFGALRASRKPVDMYVFPNEYHVKAQPSHRSAIYRRSVQWFKFWLQGIEEAVPTESDQYVHWRALRTDLEQSLSLTKR